LEDPTKAIKDLIPREKGREEREARETEGDQAEVEGESAGAK